MTGPTTAVQRLTMSRERLRLACARPAQAADDAPGGAREDPLVAGAWRAWIDRRWATHPLRLAGGLLANAGDALLAPVAQRHPVRMVALAALAGAAVVALRPWRRLWLTGLLAAWLPRLLPRGLAMAAPATPGLPWLAVLDALLPPQRASAPRAAAHAPAD